MHPSKIALQNTQNQNTVRSSSCKYSSLDNNATYVLSHFSSLFGERPGRKLGMGAYLSYPVTKKAKTDGSNEQLSFGSCSMQGWRKDMEDSHFEIGTLTENKDSLFAVFDGHGGSAVSKFCCDNFTSVLKSEKSFECGKMGEALRRTYMKLDELLEDASNGTKLRNYGGDSGDSLTGVHPSAPQVLSPVVTHRRSVNFALNTGCTAVVVHIDGSKMTVANTGDSRAVLCRDGAALELTTDHKTTLASELDRISAAGGIVLNGRVNGSLNLTRAIGDLAFKGDPSLSPERQVITADPDITEVILDPHTDDFIVIACDGLWEVMTSQEVVDYVSHGLHAIRGNSLPASPSASVTSIPPSCLSDLIGRMLDIVCSDDVGKTEGLGGDNLSCIIVDLRPNKALSNLDKVSRCDITDPFVIQPESYKAFQFRTGSSDGEDFTDGDWECRIERLDDSNFEHSSASP